MKWMTFGRAKPAIVTAGVLSAATLVASHGQVSAYEARLRPQFERLELQTRLEEVCDTEVMLRINRDHPEFVVDKVIAYTFKNPIQKNDRLSADGASFRSKERWFQLSYRCQTGPHHLDVSELKYKIGQEIDRNQWHRLYLYD